MSMVEVMVAMGIVAISLLAMLDELVTYLHQQSTQRAHATALRIATATIEDARRLPSASILTGVLPTATTIRNGVTYTTNATVQMCSATTQTSCVTPGTGASVARVDVTVAWSDSKGSHHLALSSSDVDTSQSSVSGSTTGLTDGTTGTTGTSVSVTSLSVSPTSISVDGSGNPTSNVTVTLQAVGLSPSTTIPVTWTDDNGSHQATLTNTGATTWAATIAKSSITRAVTSGSQTVVFAATVPGVRTFPTTTLTVVAQPAFNGSCTVTASPIVLTPLTRKTSLPEIVSCQTTGLASTDSVKAVYSSGSGTATANLSSSDGSTWTATLPVGTSMVSSGSSESFTFTLTRASDGYNKSQSLSVTLA
ncbi:MAG: hypothetical protein JO222_01570 [Frankiales bacterium]|nr:hypothetical protein [Frankiales bacterium]